jgi:hypothetical protein
MKELKMKMFICITAYLLLFSSAAFSQSEIDFEPGSELILETGADLSADILHINGYYSGGGTINGNPAYVLNLRVIIQGFYDSSSDYMISDMVKVYLRNISTPYEVVDSSESVLDSSGVGTFIFSNAVDGTNYYVAVKHRNSIETWSYMGNSFFLSSLVYNFSDTASKAFGNNQIQVDNSPLKFALYSGDVNQDGVIDAADLSLIDVDASNFISGYVATDLNGDDFTDATDLSIADNNAANFITIIRP